MGIAGREKEAIIISMVRSNDSGTVGFLSDSRCVIKRLVIIYSMVSCLCAKALDQQTPHDGAGG